MCNNPPPPASGGGTGSPPLEVAGVVSIDGNDYQQAYLGRGEKRIAVSYSRISLMIDRLNGSPVDFERTTDLVTLSGGIGLRSGFSIWGEFQGTRVLREGVWRMGQPSFGFRWKPALPDALRGIFMYLNEGIVIPTGSSDDPVIGKLDGGVSPPVGRVYMNRTTWEIWVDSRQGRLFGFHFLWDFPLNKTSGSNYPGDVVQLSLRTVDRRFALRGIIPYLALGYRHENLDRRAGRVIGNSGGWYVHGTAAVTARVSSRYHATFSISGPLVVGIKGTELRQVNFGLAVSRRLATTG